MQGDLEGLYANYRALKLLKKPCSMPSIHLNMMKLEGDGKRCLKPAFTEFAPHHHRITELIRVLVHDAVKLRLYHGRCADNHILIKHNAFRFIGYLFCQYEVIAVKLLQIIVERDIA